MFVPRIDVPTVGTAPGDVPSVPVPIGSMDFVLSGQFTMVNSTLGISSSAFATTAQGALAATALQNAAAFATASQGTKADTALQPNAAGLITADTGWTANSTSGNKTAVLVAYTNSFDGTMVTAVNLVSSGAGTAISTGLTSVALLVQKVAAIETALVSFKVPNA